MATTNGSVEYDDDNQSTSTHLGKRKRSESPQKVPNGAYPSEFQQKLQNALNKVERGEPTDSLLDYPLPLQVAERPDTKRARLSSHEEETTTIESKIKSGAYTSLHQVEHDAKSVSDALSRKLDGVNGDIIHKPKQDTASELIALLSAHINPTSKAPAIPQHQQAGQIITLRSQTEKGTQQLYSGLQVDKENAQNLVIDGRRLPNGFDLTDPATIDSTLLAPTKDKRLFGDVFRSRPTIKQLEQPRPRQANRGTSLRFEPGLSLEKATPVNRNDYKHQTLPTSTWISYSKGASSNDPDSLKKQRERALTATDFRAALAGNDVAGSETGDTNTLFKKAFSSFTPTYDSSRGLINEEDHNRSFWRRYGRKRLSKIFKTEYPELDDESGRVNETSIDEDIFKDAVANFKPLGDSEEVEFTRDDPESVDDVLDEVSQLLETVHSYQSIRAASNRNTDISGDEVDTYELLRSQLSILVSSLPPFAIAKLDGEKLNDLNISANLLVEGADYRGTGQADDHTLQRYRAAQQATSAATRAPQQPPARTQYPTPSMVQRYGTSYGQTASQTAYVPRPATTYLQTPTAQRPYQPNTYNPQAAVQQFQRPTQNGYNYNAQTPQPFSQTPSQPGYQQRAQQSMAYGRTTSPTNPVVNGQTPVYNQQPQYQRPPQQPYSPTPQQTPGHNVVNGA